MVNFATWIPDYDSLSQSCSFRFLSSDASICSTMVFPPLANFDDIISVSIDFPSNSQWYAPYRCIAYEYYCVDCDSLCDHLRDVPWEDISKLSASAANELCECVQVGMDVYISHCKYQI